MASVYIQSSLALLFCMFTRPQWQHLLQVKDTPTHVWWSCQKQRKALVSTSWEEKSRTPLSTSPASSPEALPTVTVASREETSCFQSMEWYVDGFDQRWYLNENQSYWTCTNSICMQEILKLLILKDGQLQLVNEPAPCKPLFLSYVHVTVDLDSLERMFTCMLANHTNPYFILLMPALKRMQTRPSLKAINMTDMVHLGGFHVTEHNSNLLSCMCKQIYKYLQMCQYL